MKDLEITAVYKSGREELHFCKATKGLNNKAKDKLIKKLRTMPTVTKIKVFNPNEEERRMT